MVREMIERRDEVGGKGKKEERKQQMNEWRQDVAFDDPEDWQAERRSSRKSMFQKSRGEDNRNYVGTERQMSRATMRRSVVRTERWRDRRKAVYENVVVKVRFNEA